MIEPHETPRRNGVPDLLTVAEAAAILRTGLTYAYESTGRYIVAPNPYDIPAIKVGRHTRVPGAGSRSSPSSSSRDDQARPVHGHDPRRT